MSKVARPIVLHEQDPNTGRLMTRNITLYQWRVMIRRQGVREFGMAWGVLFNRYFGRCESFEVGRNRVTFMFRTYVVKLPITCAGIGDNDWEGSVSNIPGEQGYVQYARTRLHYKGDMPILFMERVEPVSGKQIVERMGFEPDWVYSVDCGQVGFNRAGRLVAYDYGYN